MARLVDIHLESVTRLARRNAVVLEVDTSAREWLAEAGFVPAYGARPLHRLVRR